MSNDSESGFAQGSAIVYPLLLECDSHGQVLWMSERTRSVLGSADNLVDALAAGSESVRAAGSGASLRFFRLLTSGDRMLISAQPVDPAALSARPDAIELSNLQGNFLRNYFRLQLVERNLSTRARNFRRVSGAGALRQVERERQRLARELHTGVGQALAAISLQVAIVDSQLPAPADPVRQALDRIRALAGDALQQVRSVARNLHPPEWQRLTLADALRQLWDMSGIPQRMEASLRLDPTNRDPDFEIKVLLYRAAQEALSNAARHSRATRIVMSLEDRAGRLVLTVADNGVGFDVAAALAAPAHVAAGLGLRSIREQALSLGAAFEIESGPNGTTLEVSTPYSSREP